MDDSDVIVDHSDWNEFEHDDLKSVKFSEKQSFIQIHARDEYFQSYNASNFDVSNYTKEINLDDDQISDSQILLEPRFHGFKDFGLLKPHNRQFSRGVVMEPPDPDEPECQNSSNHPIKSDVRFSSQFPEATFEAPAEKPLKMTATHTTPNGSISGISSQMFDKNEGKLIFKITRYSKTTQKEKLITKTRRVISKWPHTSSKYYAKGMWKRCYHNFGREKKAFVWGHTDKPLYAKGYWKQWYLSKYKEKQYSNPEMAVLNRRGKKNSQVSVPVSTTDNSSLRTSEGAEPKQA